ncbi:PREDICTED: binding partner of ACD11 1 [Ipomoea nil]|uniref:binding partner of ACD11 1 n=1 Tax=Ipomoea nil TaxID=35883 RepID=UPI00090193D5|nr:PREDICTED: binding partner of ACD11 1 [Ipomoea nil]
MNPGGYTAEVTSLSPIATEKNIHDFFALCGKIDHIEIVRAGEHASTAYVTFRSSHALETAVLLSGATILDQQVCIARWGYYEDEYDYWNQSSWKPEEARDSTEHTQGHQYAPSAGEAVTMAQDVVKTMVSRGYVLGKDALGKARAFDESHQLSATAAAKVADLSERMGLTDKIFAGVEAARSVDQRYHILDNTKSAVSATGRSALAAANAVVNSSYFSKGALWVSDALSKASKAAADLGGGQGINK